MASLFQLQMSQLKRDTDAAQIVSHFMLDITHSLQARLIFHIKAAVPLLIQQHLAAQNASSNKTK